MSSKSRYARRKARAGYQSPGERPGYRTCQYRSADVIRYDSGHSVALDCRLHGFFVAPGGTCGSYQLAGLAGLKSPGDAEFDAAAELAP
jgi:hypothetical protein